MPLVPHGEGRRETYSLPSKSPEVSWFIVLPNNIIARAFGNYCIKIHTTNGTELASLTISKFGILKCIIPLAKNIFTICSNLNTKSFIHILNLDESNKEFSHTIEVTGVIIFVLLLRCLDKANQEDQKLDHETRNAFFVQQASIIP